MAVTAVGVAVDELLDAARGAQGAPTGVDAGTQLADGGWAVFPVPAGRKYDSGPGALSYARSTVDPGVFEANARDVMERWNCRDVNVCLTPGRCTVPLVVVDLDGAEAIGRFWDAAREAGEAEDRIRSWWRVVSPRADGGRHVYFTTPGGVKYGNTHHVWGGDVRSGRGHVVVPPSLVDAGRYTLAGERLVEAPEWVVAGLGAQVVGDGPARVRTLERGEASDIVDRLSQWETKPYGAAAIRNIVAEVREAKEGSDVAGRNPTMNKGVNRLLDLALEREVNAHEALAAVCAAYEAVLAFEPRRDAVGEFTRSIVSWAERKEDLAGQLAAYAGRDAWAARHRERQEAALETEVRVEVALTRLTNARTVGDLFTRACELREVVVEEAGLSLAHGGVGMRALDAGEFCAGEAGRAAVRRGLLG